MSKNLKCPVCQKGAIMFKENLSCECSQCRFQCHHGQIERIAAAMELAQATNDWYRNKGTHGHVVEAQNRVMEFFK